MALFFQNQKCSLCQKEMTSVEDVFSFQAFIPNTKDAFYQFNDAVFHTECLKKHSLGVRAIKFADEFIFKTRPQNRICSVGKNRIQSFEDYIFITLLTSIESEELYKFNFTTIDRNNLEKWGDRIKFITAAIKFKEENKWGDYGGFKYLDDLIKRIIEG